MESKSNAPLLFFLHIPKTAGSSIHQILHAEYGNRLGIVYGQDLGKWNSTLRLPDHGLDCLFGHYWFGLHSESVRTFEYSAMMRDPVDAILSYYSYIQAQPTHWLYPYAHAHPLDEFVYLPDNVLNLFWKDYQSAYLIGKSPTSAKEVIANVNLHFPIIGITELYHESIYLMRRRYGWKSAKVYHVNASPNRLLRERIHPNTIARIEQLVATDILVYRFARKRLLKAVQSLKDKDKQAIKQFKATGILE